MQICINYLNSSLVDADPAVGARSGVRVRTQKTLSIGVLMPLLLTKTLPASSSLPAGKKLQQRFQQVGGPIIANYLAGF